MAVSLLKGFGLRSLENVGALRPSPGGNGARGEDPGAGGGVGGAGKDHAPLPPPHTQQLLCLLVTTFPGRGLCHALGASRVIPRGPPPDRFPSRKHGTGRVCWRSWVVFCSVLANVSAHQAFFPTFLPPRTRALYNNCSPNFGHLCAFS